MFRDIFEKITKEKTEIEKEFGKTITEQINEYEKMLLSFDIYIC